MSPKLDAKVAQQCLQKYLQGGVLSQEEMQLAVRYSLQYFAVLHPGRAVEIRIPWVGAVQALPGVNHRRGTPPNVVEMDGTTWLQLVLTGKYRPAAIACSGAQADIFAYFPLPDILTAVSEEKC